jgi:hypothetical protein
MSATAHLPQIAKIASGGGGKDQGRVIPTIAILDRYAPALTRASQKSLHSLK